MDKDERTLALYIRVSTEEQASDGNSLAEQEEQLIKYAVGNGFNRYKVYRDDGYSAKHLDRPAMRELRNDIANGLIAGVVTTRLDRLTRKVSDFARMVDEMNDHDVFYRATRQNFEISTAMGKLMANILSAIAEFERELIAERVYENLYAMAKSAKLPMKPAFGYDSVDGQLVVNPEEAKWVRKMADMLLSGRGTMDVVQMLNKHGVLSKTGRLWNPNSIRTLFRNESLIGKYVWNQRAGTGKGRKRRDERDWIEIEQHHEPLLSVEEFERINEIISSRRALPARSRGRARLLSGIAKCGFCGGPMHGTWHVYNVASGKKRVKTYKCGTYLANRSCPYINRVSCDDLDAYVIAQLMKMADSGPATFEASIPPDDAPWQDRIAQMKRSIKQDDERVQRLFDALALGVIRPDEFSSQKARIEIQRNQKEAELERLLRLSENNDPGLFQHEFKNRLQRLRENLDGDFDLQRLAVLQLVHEVRVFREDFRKEPEVQIVYKL